MDFAHLNKNSRKDSSLLLLKTPVKDLDVPPKDVAKVLFLSTNPVHNQHSAGSSDSDCAMCRLVMKLTDAIRKKNLKGLKLELKKKVAKLAQMEVTHSMELSTLESNFSDENEELTMHDEELLVFCETLDVMNIPIPDVLKDKLENILSTKKIPARKSAHPKCGENENQEEKNNFLAYTTNKILSEIGENLTAEEVVGLKNFILEQEEKDGSVKDLKSSLATLGDVDVVENPDYKDILFYCIITNMRKASILNRLHTHVLQFFLDGSHKRFSDPNSDSHIDMAIEKLSRYPMTVNPPGICIIVSVNEGRAGADDDVIKVKRLFEQDLNYNVLGIINPTAKKLKDLVSELEAKRYQFYDSLVVWFMGHGDKSYLRIKDRDIHRRTEFIQPFADIEWLRKKPKLFFIQACANRRQSKRTPSMQSQALETEQDSIALGMSSDKDWNEKYGAFTDGQVVNPLADTLISYATLWYEKAARNETGSLFINTLLASLKEHGKKKSIELVLRDTHYKVNTVSLTSNFTSWKQTPYYESSLQKEFVFP